MLASSQGISSWTPLKPQHSNPNPNRLANQLWCIDFLTPPTPIIIPHRLPAFFESLMPLKHWCSIHARWSKSSLKHSIRFCTIFSKFKTQFSLKLVDKFTYLGNSGSSTENDIDTRLTKAWTAIDKLSIIWKSDLIDKMKRTFFQAAVVSILLYRCNTSTLTKRLEKKLDGNYTRMLRAILNKSWRQHPTKHQLYGHLPPITKTI